MEQTEQTPNEIDVNSPDTQEESITPVVNDIYQLREKLYRKEVKSIKSLRVYNFEGQCIMEAAVPNEILETQEKYFKATSGIVQFGQSKNWSFKQKSAAVLSATRSIGAAKIVIDFQLT